MPSINSLRGNAYSLVLTSLITALVADKLDAKTVKEGDRSNRQRTVPQELYKPTMTEIDKLDEKAVLEILQKDKIDDHQFKKVFVKELHKEAKDAAATMLHQPEFEKAGFDFYTLGKRVFFKDKASKGDLYLVDRFKGDAFEFAKLSKGSSNGKIQTLLGKFRADETRAKLNAPKNLDEKIKFATSRLGSQVSDYEEAKVIAAIKELPKVILEDLFDPDWGLTVKIVDGVEVMRKPELIQEFVKDNSLERAKITAQNSGAFYTYGKGNPKLGGDLIVFTERPGINARIRQNIHHELGHTIDHRSLHFYQKDPSLAKDLLLSPDELDEASWSPRFLDAHKRDIGEAAKDYAKKAGGYFDRLSYYDDAIVDGKSLSTSRTDKRGAGETFAEVFASLVDRRNDPLASRFKKMFPKSMEVGQKAIEAIYGKDVFK